MSGIWALVPFKGAVGAKRRLSPHLDEHERRALVEAMLRDVLETLSGHSGLAGVLLVSRAADAKTIAAEFGAIVFEEPPGGDLSDAVVQAGAYLTDRKQAAGTLFVPGDVPLIRAADLDAVLGGHVDVTLVPDQNDVGTNCAVSSPANNFTYLFDGKSFHPHCREARAAGFEPRIVRTENFGLDIDTLAELQALIARRSESRTQSYLAASGIASRLAGQHNSRLT